MPFTMDGQWLSPEEEEEKYAAELARKEQQHSFITGWEQRFKDYQQTSVTPPVTSPEDQFADPHEPIPDPGREAFREHGFTQPLAEIEPLRTRLPEEYVSPVVTAKELIEEKAIAPELAERKVWDRPAGISTRTGVEPRGETWAEEWRDLGRDRHGTVGYIIGDAAGTAAAGAANLMLGFETALKGAAGFGTRAGKNITQSMKKVAEWTEQDVPESLKATDRWFSEQIEHFEDPSEPLLPEIETGWGLFDDAYEGVRTAGREMAGIWEEVHQRARRYDQMKEWDGALSASLAMEGLHTASEVGHLLLQMELLSPSAPTFTGKYGTTAGRLAPGVSQAKAIDRTVRSHGFVKRMGETMRGGIEATARMPQAQRTHMFQRLQRMGAHGLVTTPGEASERIESAVYRLAYNITPYLANATGLTGLGAKGTDVLLNTFLTSPMYGKAWHEAGGPTSEFWSFAIPQLVMDFYMAKGTRGLAEMGRLDARQDRIEAVAEDRGLSPQKAEEYVRFVEQAVEGAERAQGERLDPVDYKQYTDQKIVPPMPTERQFGLSPRAELDVGTVRTMADPEARLTPERLEEAEFDFRGLPVRPEDVELAARSFDPEDRQHIHFKHGKLTVKV